MQEVENAKEVAVSVMDKVSAYIDAIAARLGVAGEAVWEILVRQMYIEGFGYLGLFLLFSTTFGLSIWGLKKASGMEHTNMYDMDARDFTYIMSTIGGIVSFSLIILFAWNALMYLGNPEYQALMSIVNAVK